jgi:hypothetical protein
MGPGDTKGGAGEERTARVDGGRPPEEYQGNGDARPGCDAPQVQAGLGHADQHEHQGVSNEGDVVPERFDGLPAPGGDRAQRPQVPDQQAGGEGGQYP